MLGNGGCGGQKVPYKIESKYTVTDPRFLRTMGHLLGPPIAEGNSVTTLVNGDGIFPPMLDAVRAAKKTINFETFIYWRGSIAREFADALAERARAGVKVHAIIDAIGGSKIDRGLVERMTDAGVEVRTY